MLVPTIRYASRAITLFSLIVVITAGLELLENADLLSKQREGWLRVVFAGSATMALVVMTVRAPLSASLRAVILCGLSLIMVGHFNSYTQHVETWNQVPVFGRNSPARRWIEPLISGGWVLTVVYIAFRAVRSLQRLHTESLRRERLRAIGEMTSGIAHDLNNALTPLVGSAELLIASIPNPSARQQRLCNLLDKAAVDVSGIIDRVSHFQAPDNPVRREVVRLKELVDEAIAGMRPILKAHAELDGINLQLQNDVLAETLVDVCPTEIRVLLTNLLLNAVQVMPSGGNVCVTNYYRANQMLVDVKDSGTGMERDELRRCTEPFYTTKSSGSGLGLPTCRQIVESYGCQLEIRSTPGKGTTVTFGLPEPDVLPATSPGIATGQIAVRRILLVEDEAEVRRTLQLMLGHLDLSVVEAETAEAAIREYRRTSVDLVLTDFGLPDMTGAELIRELRQHNDAIPMIVLSGWGTESILSRCDDQAGPDQILKKPVSMADLRTALAAFSTSVEPARARRRA